jgi:hypothetical protein
MDESPNKKPGAKWPGLARFEIVAQLKNPA